MEEQLFGGPHSHTPTVLTSHDVMFYSPSFDVSLFLSTIIGIYAPGSLTSFVPLMPQSFILVEVPDLKCFFFAFSSVFEIEMQLPNLTFILLCLKLSS